MPDHRHTRNALLDSSFDGTNAVVWVHITSLRYGPGLTRQLRFILQKSSPVLAQWHSKSAATLS